MINVDATDVLEGIASVTNVVEFTCSVVDGTTVKSVEGKLTNSQTTIYTATAATRVLSLTLVNTHSAAVTVNIQKDPADAGTLYRIIPKDLSLGIKHMLVFDGQRCSVMDASGNILSINSAHAATHKTGGADPLLAGPGAIGGTTPGAGTFAALLGEMGIVSSGGNITLSTVQVLGHLVLITGAGTVTLPPVTGANGWCVLVYSTVAAAVHIDPDNNDRMILDGVALDDGDKATSTSSIGDCLLLVNNDANGWIAISNNSSWADGG